MRNQSYDSRFLQCPASHPGTVDKSPGTKVQFLSSLNYISCIVVISFFQLWPYSCAEMRHLPEASGQSVPRRRRQEIHDNAKKKFEAVCQEIFNDIAKIENYVRGHSYRIPWYMVNYEKFHHRKLCPSCVWGQKKLFGRYNASRWSMLSSIKRICQQRMEITGLPACFAHSKNAKLPIFP